jgi:arginine decarboxylase
MWDSDSGDAPTGLALTTYNSVWQLRIDAWSSLADSIKRFSHTALPPEQQAVLQREITAVLGLLDPLEMYWAYPGRTGLRQLQENCEVGDYESAMRMAGTVARSLSGEAREVGPPVKPADGDGPEWGGGTTRRPAFDVLIVDDIPLTEAQALREEMWRLRRPEDPFSYELVVVPSFEDALVAVLLNSEIQACVVRSGLAVSSAYDLTDLRHFLESVHDFGGEQLTANERMLLLGEQIAERRPEVDLYLVAKLSLEQIAGRLTHRFRRIFDRQDALELHLSILAGVEERNETPFFTALRGYSRQPTGVFHALPISRGKSVVNSKWIRELSDFYGLNMFLAETSATSGGLDSLLEPTGTIKRSQELAARAFGAQRTFFVTNGTSTANKIVVQSIVTPGDVVLVDRNCHKSHHYGLMLGGARVSYLEAYPLDAYSMYGAVPLASIKRRLLEYRRAGRLGEVKMLSLTNCTFDGIVYDVERVMEECLAIKPDLVFLWDEAWFAFASFHPIYRQRTAMSACRRLQERYQSAEYAQRYASTVASKKADEDDSVDEESWLRTHSLPDPQKVRIRVYATQSTHKTLTALRQGSMIHVFDQDFNHRNEEAFREAYMTHTSTSPNYQILASLDVGRKQAELEGYQLVQKQAELAMSLYDAVESHPLIRKYFRFLTTREMIPAQYRLSGIELPLGGGFAEMDRAWARDEFVIDPSRLTLFTGQSGVDGDTFKHSYLMDKYGIQVNKTARNSVLFMTNIGTNRSSVAYLIEVLVKLAKELDEELARLGPMERRAREQRVAALTGDPPALPHFSRFANRFRHDPTNPDGDLRSAYFLAYELTACEYLSPAELTTQVASGREVVSAMFVTPYPPGFPILVPGQVVTSDVLAFMSALDTREIHGYVPDFGYRVFTEAAMKEGPPGSAMASKV